LAAILVADRKVHVRDTLQRRLQREGHTVAVARTVEDTVSQLKFWNFDLVVIEDAFIVGDRSNSIVHALRASPLTRVILMSHRDAEAEARQELEVVKVAGTLSKPITYGELDELVGRALAV